MEDVNLYRSKLRSPGCPKTDLSGMHWENPSSSGYVPYDGIPGNRVMTPSKIMASDVLSPHKSGYFLRTPSPLKKLRDTMSPSKSRRIDNPGTPSPQKAGSATDLFGNKSLLDNLEVPEDWDENFLNNFQDDWLFGFGSEDLDNLTKSPLKSPRRGLAFQTNTPKKLTSGLSPFKSPLLTSSPKFYTSSPAGDKTPGMSGGRPVTRQRKLFLQSPEHRVPQPSAIPSAWVASVPLLPTLDTSSSSLFSEGGLESSSIQSISSYLKNIDQEDNQDDLPVMPPAGWTAQEGKGVRVGKVTGKGVSKSSKSKRGKAFTSLENAHSGNINCHPSTPVAGTPQLINSKKVKVEPQFTLLRPYTELHTNQISLRTTPVTPPNKVKISRDFSQIQTLPSKEQLRIVRSRFRDTLNKAVEQVIEKEQLKRGGNPQKGPSTQVEAKPTQLQAPVPQQAAQAAVQFNGLLPQCNLAQFNIAVKPPPLKKRKR